MSSKYQKYCLIIHYMDKSTGLSIHVAPTGAPRPQKLMP